MVLLQKRESRAPPIHYNIWPHLIRERERKEAKTPVDLKRRVPQF